MINRQRLVTRCQKAAAATGQLLGMKLDRQAKFGCHIEQRCNLVSVKGNRFTKSIDLIHQSFLMCLA